MQSMFRPKHQKLILQCYPSTKLSTAETKPNQAELSYLVFYASSRRTKLEKVGEFLLKKTTADISHQRVGHLKVTLYILQELIVKCSEDLGFMTPYVISIMKDIIKLRDLPTSQLACQVFITYCETLQNIQRQVFSSNVTLLQQFLEVISLFLSFSSIKNSSGSSNDWLRISLKISLVIAEYIDASFSQFGKDDLIRQSINLILDTLQVNQTDLSLGKINTSNSQVSKHANDNSIDSISLDELATNALKMFFNTNSKHQLDSATNSVLNYSIENNMDIRWTNNIMITCIKKSHIELRHRVMIIISHHIQKYAEKNDVKTLGYLLRIISTILGSTLLQFIGLPVLEISGRIVNLEKLMVKNNQVNILKESYSEIVRNLASRVYYNNQINDMITSIFSNYYYICNKTDEDRLSEEHLLSYTKIIIDNVRDIIGISQKSDIIIKVNDFPLSIFNYLYLQLPFEQHPNISQQVQLICLKLVEEFYSTIDQETTKHANSESCITSNSDNNLCLFFESLNLILSHDVRDEIKAQISLTISVMVKAFKINLLINFVKVSNVWLSDPTSFKYVLSLLILGLSSSEINGSQKLAELADSHIAYSQQQHTWPEYIGYRPSTNSSDSTLTNDELMAVLKDIDEVNYWLEHINIKEPLSFNRQIPKPYSTLILMSASNSILSFPNESSGEHTNNGTIKTASDTLSNIPVPSIRQDGNALDEVLNNNEEGTSDINTSYTMSENDYSDIEPPIHFSNGIMSGNRSLRSGFSGFSGRSSRAGGRRMNLNELKSIRGGSNSNASELSKLVKIRTGSTLNAINNGGAVDNVTSTSRSNGTSSSGSGLAYFISGLGLDDDDEDEDDNGDNRNYANGNAN